MTDLIYGAGAADAQLMIIGDYARKADDSNKQALSGYYKTKLDESLKIGDYSINQTYRTTIIKQYLPGLGVGPWTSDKIILKRYFDNKDNESSLDIFIKLLIEEINEIKPSIILALGELPLRILTEKEGLVKWRGSVLSLCDNISTKLDIIQIPKIIPTYHPSIIFNQEELQYIIRLDVKKAIDLIFDPRPIDYHEIHIAKSSIDLIKFTDQYPKDQYANMTIDIETHYGFITCAGISFDGFRGICIPLCGSSLDIIEKSRMMYLLSQLLEERTLINQNIGYDKRICNRFGLWMQSISWDTMLAAHTIACEFPKRLDFLTSIHTDMSFYKDEGREFNPSIDNIDVLYSYNVKDAITTFQIYQKQVEELRNIEMYEFFTEFVMKLFELYYDLDSTGILVDISKRDELRSKYEALYRIKTLELNSITSIAKYPVNEININSPSQIGKFMEMNSFPILKHRVASGYMVPNTDVDSLRKMRIADERDYKNCSLSHENALRFINLVLLLRRIDKILEYINVGIHPNGRIHTSSKLHGTTSGRTSGGQTIDSIPYFETVSKSGESMEAIKFKQLGQSFQTVTKHGFIIEGDEDVDIEEGIIGNDLRDMYIPDPNYVFVEIDGKQAEARVCEVLCEDYESLANYEKKDIHCEVASMIFNTFSYDEIYNMAKVMRSAEGAAMRNIGKHSKHAKNNGMEEYEFAKRYLHMANFKDSINKARMILHRIDKAYPKIEQVFHKEVEFALRSTRCLISPKIYGVPTGRKRIFYKKIDKHYLNVAYSFLPQCTISDNTKATMLRMKASMDNTKAFFVAENHDSITSLVHYSYIRPYINIAQNEFTRGIDFRYCTLNRDFELKIPIDIHIGRSHWGNMKEIKKIKEEQWALQKL